MITKPPTPNNHYSLKEFSTYVGPNELPTVVGTYGPRTASSNGMRPGAAKCSIDFTGSVSGNILEKYNTYRDILNI